MDNEQKSEVTSRKNEYKLTIGEFEEVKLPDEPNFGPKGKTVSNRQVVEQMRNNGGPAGLNLTMGEGFETASAAMVRERTNTLPYSK